MNVASEITDHLLLGSGGTRTPEFLKENGITLVINAANIKLKNKCTVREIRVKCDDAPNANLKKHFKKMADEIFSEKEKGGKILVHCIAGISRSPSLVMAYLMCYENMTLLDAYELVHSKRLFIRPNLGFWEQLVQYEEELKGTNTVTMIPHGKKMIPSVYRKEYENLV